MEIGIFHEAQKIWSTIADTTEQAAEFIQELKINRKALDLFNVGSFYFYLFDLREVKFKYISPEVTALLGYEPDKIDVNFFLSKIHPDDHATFLNNENQVIAFFKKLPNEKVPKYKVSYDYRVMTSSGKYIRILQQVVTLQYDKDNNILITMGVHTDISHLKRSNTSSLSFIGLDGEPSFNNVAIAEKYKSRGEVFTKREKEIIGCLLAGDQTQEIAKKLYISKHTVDTHRRNILSKTDSRTTLELAIKVMAGQLL